MPRPNKPWFRASRSEWYVTIKGERHRLGPDKEEAHRQFHLLMAGEEPEPVVQERKWAYASEIADQFVGHLRGKRKAQATIDWYLQYLRPFMKRFMTTRADTLTIGVVENWVHDTWETQPSQRAALRAIKAAFRRAVLSGLIPASPLAMMQLPDDSARDYVVGPDEYQKVLAAIKDPSFADLVRFVWLTGARPQEAVLIEDKHVEVANGRIVMPARIVKGKKRVRVIYLEADAMELVQARMTGGRLFRTARGQAFTKDIVRQRFKRLEATLGFRYCLYHFRHGFAHRSLAAGNDALTVATLLGQRGVAMIAKVYGHLNQADEHLRGALKKTK